MAVFNGQNYIFQFYKRKVGGWEKFALVWGNTVKARFLMEISICCER